MQDVAVRVAINGSQVEGLLHASIVTSNCFSADSFALTFAVGLSPLDDIVFWSSVSSAYVEIDVTTLYEPAPFRLISGLIDALHVDPIQRTVSIEGRDLSSSMIDGYRQQDFVNQTASEVVSTIAQNHGLTPVVTATSGSVGRYYGDGYTRLSLGQFSRLRSDWDLVVQLARENGFDVFVQGSSLYFRPSASSAGIPVYIAFRDVKAMRFEQTLTIASNKTARVQSWDSQNMASYGSNSSGDGTDTVALNSAPSDQPFLFSGSNLTSQQVTDSAGRYAAELGRLGTVLHIEMPWNLTISPRTEILINETGSVFDAIYEVDHIERHYSTTTGSTQILRAVFI
jgi:hypothetical protein